jgi:hypothetical protein
LTNYIFPISLRGHSMKKFSFLIPKLNQPLSKSLPLVSILHGKKIMNFSLNDHPELEFMMG